MLQYEIFFIAMYSLKVGGEGGVFASSLNISIDKIFN